MKTISYFSHIKWSLAIVTITFGVCLTFPPLKGGVRGGWDSAFLLTFGTFYYFFFTGFFLYRLYYPYEKLDFIQIFCYSLLLSISVNSLTFYLLSRALHIPMTMQNVTLTATAILGAIFIGHLFRFRRILL